MKKILSALILLSIPCFAQEFKIDEKQLAQQMEANKHVMHNGMSYQILKRCGANAEMLKKVKSFLDKNIAESLLIQYPLARVNIPAMHDEGTKLGDELYEAKTNKTAFCSGFLIEAKKYMQ